MINDDQWCKMAAEVFALIMIHVINFRDRKGIQLPKRGWMKLPVFGACRVSNPDKMKSSQL